MRNYIQKIRQLGATSSCGLWHCHCYSLPSASRELDCQGGARTDEDGWTGRRTRAGIVRKGARRRWLSLREQGRQGLVAVEPRLAYPHRGDIACASSSPVTTATSDPSWSQF